MKRVHLLPLLALSALLTACGQDPEPAQYGPEPQLPAPERGLLPAMKIANPAEWGDQRPVVPQGIQSRPLPPVFRFRASSSSYQMETSSFPKGAVERRRT